jgi:hypothetical protein
MSPLWLIVRTKKLVGYSTFGIYLNALRQTGQGTKAGTVAEQQLQRDSSNEDVLLFAADYNRDKKDNAQAHRHTNRFSGNQRRTTSGSVNSERHDKGNTLSHRIRNKGELPAPARSREDRGT